jgi:hypothetical protein
VPRLCELFSVLCHFTASSRASSSSSRARALELEASSRARARACLELDLDLKLSSLPADENARLTSHRATPLRIVFSTLPFHRFEPRLELELSSLPRARALKLELELLPRARALELELKADENARLTSQRATPLGIVSSTLPFHRLESRHGLELGARTRVRGLHFNLSKNFRGLHLT